MIEKAKQRSKELREQAKSDLEDASTYKQNDPRFESLLELAETEESDANSWELFAEALNKKKFAMFEPCIKKTITTMLMSRWMPELLKPPKKLTLSERMELENKDQQPLDDLLEDQEQPPTKEEQQPKEQKESNQQEEKPQDKSNEKPIRTRRVSQGPTGGSLRVPGGLTVPGSLANVSIRTAVDSGHWCSYGTGTGSPKLMVPADDDGNPIQPGGSMLVSNDPPPNDQKKPVANNPPEQHSDGPSNPGQSLDPQVVHPPEVDQHDKASKIREPLQPKDVALLNTFLIWEKFLKQIIETKPKDQDELNRRVELFKEVRSVLSKLRHPPENKQEELKKGDSVLKLYDPPSDGPGFPVAKGEPPPSNVPAPNDAPAAIVSQSPPPGASTTKTTEASSTTKITPESSIHVTIFIKATDEAMQRGQQATPAAAQEIALLPPTKPDLPGPHRTDTAENDGQDIGFDKDPSKCVTGPDGQCKFEISQSDLQILGIPLASLNSHSNYRMDLDLPRNDGGIIETTGNRDKPNLSDGLPAGVIVTGLEVTIGDRNFLRLSSKAPGDSKFSLVQELSWLFGRPVTVDFCRDKQPGPPNGMQPRSFSALNQSLPEALLKLDRRTGVSGGAR